MRPRFRPVRSLRPISALRRALVTAAAAAAGLATVLASPSPAQAALGGLVGGVTFSQDCPHDLVDGIDRAVGVGITFDGTNLWYSCVGTGTTDLYRADPVTGLVSASYDIDGGLGALAYDATRNAIWAGWGGVPDGQILLIQLDAGENVVGLRPAFQARAAAPVNDIDDGLAYDSTDDSLYISGDASVTVYHYNIYGGLMDSFPWARSNVPGSCFNSGLALGGDLLYEGSDGCSHVWVVQKASPSSISFDFGTAVAGDPNFRDEGLTCDTRTFAAQGKDVMWSKEAYTPMRAHAFEIPAGTCGIGGHPVVAEPTTLTIDQPVAGDFDDAVTVGARLVGGDGNPVAGANVSLVLNGAETCSGTTDATGHATCSLVPAEAAGTYPLQGTFAGDSTHLAASGSGVLTITQEESTAVYVGPTVIGTGGAQTLSAKLTEDGIGPISGRPVTITVGSGGQAQSCTGTTDATGVASCTIPQLSQPPGIVAVSVSFGGDDFYLPSSAAAQATVFASLAGGSFVVGDDEAGLNAHVTFWGAQWAKINAMSGGGGPNAFKGFANGAPLPATCGSGWTADPGNSSRPPDVIPAFMAVIVASSVSKSGRLIAGDTVHVVVVETDAGYGPNPGHAGTGTIVATVC